MKELYSFGIDDEDLSIMLEINPEIKEMTEDEIKEKDYIFRYMGCTLEQIRSILVTNPMVLSKSKDDIVLLIQRLISLGFDMLNLLFESNPYILNLEPFEINYYIKGRQDNGEMLEDIVDDLDSNPYLFNEM